MAENDPSMSIILFEIVVAQSLLIIAFIVYSIIKKRKKSGLLNSIIVKASENVDSRKKMIASGLSGLSDNKSGKLTEQLAQKEIGFYEYIVNALHSNKNQDLAGLKDAVDELYSPFNEVSADNDGSDGSSDNDLNKEEPVIPNVDQAIEDLLDDDDSEPEADANPELDLSDQGEIAEIPDDLLDASIDESKSE